MLTLDIFNPTHLLYQRPQPNTAYEATLQPWQILLTTRIIPIMPCYIRTSYNTPNSHFTDREDILEQLNKGLLSPEDIVANSPLKTCTLFGLDDLSKIEIVIEYAYSREKHFDAIFWIQSDEIVKLTKSFDRVARALKLLDPIEIEDRVISRSKVLHWLSDPAKRNVSNDESETDLAKWLVIFDDADNLGLILDYWPTIEPESVLVTSRDSLSKTDLTANIDIDLPKLSTDSSASLLLSLVSEKESSQSKADAFTISKRFHDLPIAINQVAALIRRKDMIVSEFLSSYDEKSTVESLTEASAISQQNKDRRSLREIWKLETFTSQALSLLKLLSLLDPDRIEEHMLRTAHLQISRPSNYSKDLEAYENARTELTKSSLIRRNKEIDQLTLHRLIQKVALDQMTFVDTHIHYQLAIDVVFYAWSEKYDAQSLDNEAWEASDEMISHITKLYHQYSAQSSEKIPIDILTRFAIVLNSAGW